MVAFHELIDRLQSRLTEQEREKSRWPPVGDVMLEALQDEIDTTKVSNSPLHLSLSPLSLLSHYHSLHFPTFPFILPHVPFSFHLFFC